MMEGFRFAICPLVALVLVLGPIFIGLIVTVAASGGFNPVPPPPLKKDAP